MGIADKLNVSWTTGGFCMSLFGKKPAPKPPVSKRTEAEKKQAAEKLAGQLSRQMAKKAPPTKEDKIKEMISNDPEKAAQMLRELFLKDKV